MKSKTPKGHGWKLSGVAVFAIGSTLAAAAAHSAVIIPEKEGFSGYVNLGAGGISIKSNMLASIMSGNVDLGEKQINSLSNSPDSESGVIPAVNFELSYTFAKTRTQLHVGNLLEDFLSMDLTAIAGVRQDVGRAGQVGANYRGTTIATEVWEDPYLTGANRKDTERTSEGFRVYWQQFMGSGLEFQYTYSEIDVDKERSGQSQPLTPAQRGLLDRNGDVNWYSVSYDFSSGDKKHIVTPQLSYVDRDLEGGAMSNDGIRGSVNYIYQHNDRWNWVVNVTYSDMDFKETNPIYDTKDSADNYGASVTMFYKEAFGLDNWTFNATAGYFEADHDIDFYDAEAAVFIVGMLRRF